MCGIVYVEKKSGGVSKMVTKRYRKQDHRGRQGFAFVGVGENGTANTPVREMTEHAILKRLKDVVDNRILFHHRLPTSTINIPCATHPIVVDNPMLRLKYYVVHNGVLRNEDVLKKNHEELGFEYTTEIVNEKYHTGKDGIPYRSETETTFNDSEALAIDLALTLEGHQEKMKASGSIAFIALVCDKDDKAIGLLWGRNGGNPLVMERSGDHFSIKSEGEGENVVENVLYSYDYSEGVDNITTKPFDVGVYFSKPTTPANDWRRMGYGTHNEDSEQSRWFGDYRQNEKGEWENPTLPIPYRDTNPYDTDEIEDYSFSKHWDDYQAMWWEVDAIKEDIANAEFNGEDTTALKEALKKQQEVLEEIEFKIMEEEYGEGIGA